MVGHDARDCDAGVKERPRNSRCATLDDGKSESASICGRESHPNIRLELRAVSLAKVTERPIALCRSRCEQCPRCLHFGMVDRAQNLKEGDTLQRIGGPAEKLASRLVRSKNDQIIEIKGYERVRALAQDPAITDGVGRFVIATTSRRARPRESRAQYPRLSAPRDSWRKSTSVCGLRSLSRPFALVCQRSGRHHADPDRHRHTGTLTPTNMRAALASHPGQIHPVAASITRRTIRRDSDGCFQSPPGSELYDEPGALGSIVEVVLQVHGQRTTLEPSD